jgi:hypothetical protein
LEEVALKELACSIRLSRDQKRRSLMQLDQENLDQTTPMPLYQKVLGFVALLALALGIILIVDHKSEGAMREPYVPVENHNPCLMTPIPGDGWDLDQVNLSHCELEEIRIIHGKKRVIYVCPAVGVDPAGDPVSP